MARRRSSPTWPVILFAVLALIGYLVRESTRHEQPHAPPHREHRAEPRHRTEPVPQPEAPPVAPVPRHHRAVAPENEETDEEHEQPGACGTERWATKTLTDSEASAVDLQHVRDSTVEELASQTTPAWHEEMSRLPAERTVWRVHGRITGLKLEDDSDYHVVLAGEAGQTMIIEFPTPSCAEGSRALDQITSARQKFERIMGGRVPHSVGRFRVLADPVPVVVEGVGFFDKLHGQRGRAPNGFELHPVLSIQLDESH